MSEPIPAPPPGYPGTFYPTAGDEDFDDDLIELEFKVMTFELSSPLMPADTERDELFTALLNNGWRIHDHIECPPIVTIFFHREKETPNNDE